jgi:hypothetical protein
VPGGRESSERVIGVIDGRWTLAVPAEIRTGSLRVEMSGCSPRNVIVARVERAHFAAHCERLPIGRGYRCVVTLELLSGVSLRVFTVREPEGF